MKCVSDEEMEKRKIYYETVAELISYFPEAEQAKSSPPWGILLFSMILGVFNQLLVYPIISAKVFSAFFR